MDQQRTRRSPRADSVGTIVFIDISGFTKLSERFARAGNIGAEELVATIGSTFSELLAVAYANGGRLLKFGGDALLLFFDGDGHPARACHSAVGMRRALRERGPLNVLGQRVRLRMSVGVHTGEFHFFLVGGSHRELLVTGPGISETAALEAAADRGRDPDQPRDSGRDPGVADRAEEGSGPPAPPGPDASGRRGSSGTWPPTSRLTSTLPTASRPVSARRFSPRVPPSTGASPIAFIHFDGTDELIRDRNLDDVAHHLGELVRTVQEAADRQEVTFLASDVDRDGGKMILTAGAPSSSGDDERRMLLALREIIESAIDDSGADRRQPGFGLRR